MIALGAAVFVLALLSSILEWRDHRRLHRRLLTQRARIDSLEARLEAVMGAARVLAAHATVQDERMDALLRAATALEEGRPWLS